MKHQVLAVTKKSERLVHTANSCQAACEWAMERNKSPYNILYIVVKPDGSRITIAQQRQYLARRAA